MSATARLQLKRPNGWFAAGQEVQRAVTRKYVALINNGAGTPITTLHYFKELIEEARRTEVSAMYWQYLRHRLPALELRWRNLGAYRRIAEGKETK